MCSDINLNSINGLSSASGQTLTKRERIPNTTIFDNLFLNGFRSKTTPVKDFSILHFKSMEQT